VTAAMGGKYHFPSVWDDGIALRPLLAPSQDWLPPGDLALRRKIDAWFAGVVQRTVAKAIIPEEVNLEEVPMGLEENMIRWFDEARQKGLREGRQEGRQEGRREGEILSLQKMLLQQMTLRFGHLPAKVRRQVEEISSLQELRKLGRRILRAKNLEEMGLG
jgi:flagellar biosynthesis/type III secretory pathway protein FliH